MITDMVKERTKIVLWRVYIYDSESGCEQPITIQGGTKADAKRLGNQYIRAWKLIGASITRIEQEVIET